jgi:Kef-type K+ transport system membrane component KefB
MGAIVDPLFECFLAKSDPAANRGLFKMGRWILIAALLALLAGALFGAYQGWTAHSGDVEVPPWAYAMLGVGIFFAILVGCGLMALLFYSSRKGFDDTKSEPKQ